MLYGRWSCVMFAHWNETGTQVYWNWLFHSIIGSHLEHKHFRHFGKHPLWPPHNIMYWSYLWYSILWQSINRIPYSTCRVYCLNVNWSRQLRIVYKPLRVVTVFIVINIVLLHIILPRVASVSFPQNINNKQKIPVGRCLCFRRRSR